MCGGGCEKLQAMVRAHPSPFEFRAIALKKQESSGHSGQRPEFVGQKLLAMYAKVDLGGYEYTTKKYEEAAIPPRRDGEVHALNIG